MANSRKKSTIFVDSTGDITVDAIVPLLKGMLITPSAANAVVIIKETSSGGTTMVSAKVESANESRYIDFSGFGGIELTTTFNITTLTNITAVLLYGDWILQAGKAK